MSTYTDISLSINDPVAVITLNRPDKLNAFTFDTLTEIHAAVQRASDDKSVVGIVITGAGRGFCAGLDAESLSGATSGGPTMAPYQQFEDKPGLFSYFLDVPKPIVAAINGVAAGGGMVLALMADVRIAAESASFTTVFLKRGLIAEHGSSWLLPRLVGLGRALDLFWTSDRISAASALDYGLVQRVTDDDKLLEAACDYIREIAANSAPEAVAETKRLVYRHLGGHLIDALFEAETSQNRFVARDDAKEGAMALLEKRDPKFNRIGN